MTSFFSFFIILLVAVIFSQLFLRMRIPWVVALIVGGIAIGPSGLAFFEVDPTIEFLATVGLVFLMFMAGLESQFSKAKGLKTGIIVTALLVGLVPAFVGVLVGLVFGYPLITSILLGIIFMSSAIALLVPQFQSHKVIGSQLGRTITNAAIIVDALSLILLSVFLQFATDTVSVLTLSIYPLIILFLFGLWWIIPKIRWLVFSEEYAEQQDLFEKELRFVILILIGFVVLFELVGLHAIVAGFFAGLVLSRSIQSRLLKAKLHAIGYGFFIPVFFVVIGASTDISVFADGFDAITLAGVVILALVVSKFVSGWISGKFARFNSRESALLGVSVIPQLSTALAVAFLGFGAGLLDQNLLSSIVALSLVTSILAPIMVNVLGRDLTSQQVALHDIIEEENKEQDTLE